MNVADIFSTDPKVQARIADEAIEHFKAELAKFDDTMRPHYERLNAYYQEAREDDDREASDDYGRQRDRYFADWMDARRPYLQQITQIALLKDGLSPREMTFADATRFYAGVEVVEPPA